MSSGAALVFSMSATEAGANGRFPSASQLVVMPGNGDVMALRTTFGVLISKDRGAHWDWVCETAIGYGGMEDPALGITAGGALLVGSTKGLAVSPDTGCGWGFTTLGNTTQTSFVDVAVRRGSPHSAVALASTFVGASDAGTAQYVSQLFATDDDGKSFAAYGAALDPSIVPTTVEVTSDPHRVYVSATRGYSPTTMASLFVSDDDGTTFVERAIPIDPAKEQSVFIAAVDPTNKDRVYVRTGMTTSRLLVTDDAGVTFRAVYSGGPMLGFALSPDGSRVSLGGPDDGLREASAADLVFTQRSPVPVSCLAWNGPTLYACVPQSSVLLASSSSDSAPLAPTLRLVDIRGPLACPAGSKASECAGEWDAFRKLYGIDGMDAGTGDAGTDAGDGDAPSDSGGSAGETQTSAGGSADELDAGASSGAPTTPHPDSAAEPASTGGGCGLTQSTQRGGAGFLLVCLLLGLRRRRRWERSAE